MPFAVLAQTITGNNSATFDFSTSEEPVTIGAFVYGIQSLSLVNGTAGAQLSEFSVTYVAASGTGVNHGSVELTQTMSSGFDPDQSWAQVVVLAWVGAASTSLSLGNTTNALAIGQTGSPPLSLQSQGSDLSPAQAVSVLSGFDLSFTSDNSDLVGLGAGGGLVSVPSSGPPSFVPLADGVLLGDSAFTGTVGVGSILLDQSQTGIVLQSVQSTSTLQSFPMASGYSSYAGMIQSFYMQFSSSLDPTPDLVSLNIGIEASPGAATVNMVFVGQYVQQTTGYSGKNNVVLVSASNVAGSFLLIGIP